MLIFNIMMSKDLGGIQQAFVDYSDALTMQNNKVINITSTGAEINQKITTNHRLINFTQWCILSKIYLHILIWFYKPDIIICHGNRAISFSKSFSYFLKIKAKIVGVSHNYSYKYLKKCDYVITLTNKLENHLLKNNFEHRKIIKVPNMVRILEEYSPKPYGNPICIGSFGRFVKNKGFIYLIRAIDILKKKGNNITLLLGGDGPEKENLINEVKKLKLEDSVNFFGWVSNKKIFLDKIDIFCLPSVIEPFGIILLEAIQHSKPIVTTRSGGPTENISDGIDGLLTDIKNHEGLAEKLQIIISDQKLAHHFSKLAYQKIKNNYDIKIISLKLSNSLKKIL